MKSLGIYAFTSLMVLKSISSFAEVTEITSPNQFDQVVLASKKPVVVKVGAPWCSACERAKGPFKKISENPDFAHVAFAEMDFDKNTSIAQKYDVSSLPTFLYFQDGKLAATKSGFSENLKDEINRTVAGFSEEKAAPVAAATSEATAPAATTSECALEEQNFFARAFNATKDFFVNLGNTVRGWFK